MRKLNINNYPTEFLDYNHLTGFLDFGLRIYENSGGTKWVDVASYYDYLNNVGIDFPQTIVDERYTHLEQDTTLPSVEHRDFNLYNCDVESDRNRLIKTRANNNRVDLVSAFVLFRWMSVDLPTFTDAIFYDYSFVHFLGLQQGRSNFDSEEFDVTHLPIFQQLLNNDIERLKVIHKRVHVDTNAEKLDKLMQTFDEVKRVLIDAMNCEQCEVNVNIDISIRRH